MQPEEDKLLCKHVWCDLYSGAGMHKDDVTLSLATFYCEKCLDIRVKSYRTPNHYLSREFLEDHQASQEGSSGVKS